VNQLGDSKRLRWNQVICGVALVVLCAWCFVWYFEPLLKARLLLGKEPLILQTPSELPDKTISTAPGMSLSYLGYSFEVPWVDIEREKMTTRPNMVIVPFRSGSLIWLSVYPTRYTLNILTRSSADFCAIVGNAACESDYEFENLALRTRPDELGWFKSRTHNARAFSLLLMKTVDLYGSGRSEIFSVESKEFKGFQFGAFSTNGGAIDELYSNGGKVKLMFGGKSGRITQSEINRIVQTLHQTRVNPIAAN